MTLATARPGPLRARLAGADVVHYPLTLRIPTVRSAVRRLAARPAAPRPAGALRARRARVSRGRVAPLGARRRPRDHDQLVRPRPRGRAARARPGARAPDPPRDRPRAVHARRRRSSASRSCSTRRGAGRTRTTSGCSRRSRSCAASGRSCGSCSRAAGTTGAVPDGVEVRGNVLDGRARRPLPPSLSARLPVAVRGLRPAAARGDGVRLPGRVLGRGVAARGRRRRGATLRPDRPARDRGRGPRRARRTGRVVGARSRARAALLVGGDGPRPRGRLPRASPETSPRAVRARSTDTYGRASPAPASRSRAA